VKEVDLPESSLSQYTATFLACLATILEMPLDQLPKKVVSSDPARDWSLSRWLGGVGMGLVGVASPASFSWAGPWIARVRPASRAEHRAVVMYGVPSGVAWDPSGVTQVDGWTIENGYVVAALDIALAQPRLMPAPQSTGRVDSLWIAPSAGATSKSIASLRAIAGRGLDGDRHALGKGTFPSGSPGSSLTLIELEVCQAFTPPLVADEHRRNIVTRGIELNGLVGREFLIGDVRCRGVRLCEPCKVIEGYASRPILRRLVHRAGLRADILKGGVIATDDPIRIVVPILDEAIP
jgi:hypothetical protein